jgi:redox-sensing transcriptional repressor
MYYRLLEQMAPSLSHVSCSLIGQHLGLDPTQVRKDIEMAGLSGKPKVGFVVADLLRGIEAFLGWNSPKQAILAGAGRLGSALLSYERFREYGIQIVAAFDTDPRKIGATIADKRVYLLDSLPGRTRWLKVSLGVITTPPQVAQRVANLMVQGGIRAIWNFAPVHLHVAEPVVVQNEDLGHSLASLSLRLARREPERGVEPDETSVVAPAFLPDVVLEVKSAEVEPAASRSGASTEEE